MLVNRSNLISLIIYLKLYYIDSQAYSDDDSDFEDMDTRTEFTEVEEMQFM